MFTALYCVGVRGGCFVKVFRDLLFVDVSCNQGILRVSSLIVPRLDHLLILACSPDESKLFVATSNQLVCLKTEPPFEVVATTDIPSTLVQSMAVDEKYVVVMSTLNTVSLFRHDFHLVKSFTPGYNITGTYTSFLYKGTLWAKRWTDFLLINMETLESTTRKNPDIPEGDEICRAGEAMFLAGEHQIVAVTMTSDQVLMRKTTSMHTPSLSYCRSKHVLWVSHINKRTLFCFKVSLPLVVAFLCGLHRRMVQASLLGRVQRRCRSIFDIHALRQCLRLAGALFYLNSQK